MDDCMEESINFRNSRDQTLAGVMHKPNIQTNAGKYPLAIFCHGLGSSKEGRKASFFSRILPENGIGLFRFDFTGCGGSDGLLDDTTATRRVDDLKAAYNIATSHEWVDRNRIALIGSSFGGLVSLIALAEGLQAKTAVFISPASDFKEHHRKPRVSDGIRNEFYIDVWKRDVFSLARNIRFPCLLVHGNVDDICFISGSEKLMESLPMGSKLEVIHGEGHFYKKPENFEKMIRLSAEWLKEKLATIY